MHIRCAGREMTSVAAAAGVVAVAADSASLSVVLVVLPRRASYTAQ